MTKLHKDIAVRLIQCTEDEEFTDQAAIKVRLPFKFLKSSPGNPPCLPICPFLFPSPSPSLLLSFTGPICEDTGVDQQPQEPSS